jgi:pyruvate dehydrogenase E1 component
VTELLGDTTGPVVAVTDFMKIVPEQIARFVPERTFVPLGTDGMGRSDTREALRSFFEVDTPNIVVAVLAGLAADGTVSHSVVAEAIAKYGLDPDRTDPYSV